jgi:hypothetical protein
MLFLIGWSNQWLLSMVRRGSAHQYAAVAAVQLEPAHQRERPGTRQDRERAVLTGLVRVGGRQVRHRPGAAALMCSLEPRRARRGRASAGSSDVPSRRPL